MAEQRISDDTESANINQRRKEAKKLEREPFLTNLANKLIGRVNPDAWVKQYIKPDGTLDAFKILKEQGTEIGTMNPKDFNRYTWKFQATQDLANTDPIAKEFLDTEQAYVGGSNEMNVKDKNILDPYMKNMKKNDKEIVNNLLFEEDEKVVEYSDGELNEKYKKHPEKVREKLISAHKAVREFFNNKLDLISKFYISNSVTKKRGREISEVNQGKALDEIYDDMVSEIRTRNTGPEADRMLAAIKIRENAVTDMNSILDVVKDSMQITEERAKVILSAWREKSKAKKDVTIDILIKRAAKAIRKSQERGDIKPDRLEKSLERMGFSREDISDINAYEDQFLDLGEAMMAVGEAIGEEIDSKEGPNSKLAENLMRLGLNEMEAGRVTADRGLADYALVHRGYVPHKWKSEWRVHVTLKSGKVHMLDVPVLLGKIGPTRAMRQKAAERAAYNLVSKEFKEGDVKRILVVHSSKLPVDLFEDITTASMQSIMNSAYEASISYYDNVPDDKKAELQGIFDSIKDKIYEMRLSKGWGAHLIGRKNVKGFRKDLDRVIAEYASGVNHWYNKGIKARRFGDIMEKIDPGKTPERWTWAKEYISDMLGDISEAIPAKKIISGWYLAGDFSNASLNATQNWTHAVALLKAIKPKKDPIIAEREMVRATKDVMFDWLKALREGKKFFDLGEGKLSKEEMNDLRTMLEMGYLSPAYFGEMTGLAGVNIYRDWWTQFQRGLYYMFTGTEALNRVSTAIAAIRRLKRAGDASYLKKAADLVNAAHGVYGRGAKPHVVRKLGGIGSSLYTFMTYPMFNIAFLKARVQDIYRAENIADRKTALKVFGTNLGYVAAFGGMQALPFMFILTAAVKMFDDPEDDPEILIRKHMPKAFGRAITRGIPSVFGIDFSYAVEGTDIFGAPIGYQTLKNIGRKVYYHAYLPLKRGDEWHTLLMAAPDMIANPYKAFIAPGGTGIEGKPVVEYKPGERIKKALGFIPTREAETRKSREIATRKKEQRLDRITTFAERYIKASKARDYAKIREIQNDVREYNSKEREKGIEGLPLDWKKDIIQSAKRRKKAREKGYEERLPKYMRRYQESVGSVLGLR